MGFGSWNESFQGGFLDGRRNNAKKQLTPIEQMDIVFLD